MTSSPEPLSDEALMDALRRGDDAALDTLMTRWQQPLRGFLYRLWQNEHDALDLSQETFVRIYRHRARYRPGARFSTWLFQIALNLARDQARSRSRRHLVALDQAPETADPQNPKSQALDAERVAAVRAAIFALPEDLRAVMLLSEYEDKSHAEIADIVGTTPKAVEGRLHRARERLREKLTRFLDPTNK